MMGDQPLSHFLSFVHVSAVVCSTALPDVSKNVHGLQKNSGLYVLTYYIFPDSKSRFFFIVWPGCDLYSRAT